MNVTPSYRLMVLAIALVALLAPAAAEQFQGCGSSCQDVSLGFKHTAFCELGNASFSSDPRFKPSDFRLTCTGDAGKACDSMENSVIPGDPKNTYGCCSCYLYNRFCHDARSKSKFVTDKDVGSNAHVLLMPTAPCTGVENWNKGQCPHETIWDEGRNILAAAGKDASWGMAISPVGRREQHQMHVHLAGVFPSLLDAIAAVQKSGQNSSFIDCTGSRQTSSCKATDKGDVNKNIKVTLITVDNPGKAQPFFVAYGSHPDNTNPLVLNASTLVVRLGKHVGSNVWAIVTNPTGPAECFFRSTADSCTN